MPDGHVDVCVSKPLRDFIQCIRTAGRTKELVATVRKAKTDLGATYAGAAASFQAERESVAEFSAEYEATSELKTCRENFESASNALRPPLPPEERPHCDGARLELPKGPWWLRIDSIEHSVDNGDAAGTAPSLWAESGYGFQSNGPSFGVSVPLNRQLDVSDVLADFWLEVRTSAGPRGACSIPSKADEHYSVEWKFRGDLNKSIKPSTVRVSIGRGKGPTPGKI